MIVNVILNEPTQSYRHIMLYALSSLLTSFSQALPQILVRPDSLALLLTSSRFCRGSKVFFRRFAVHTDSFFRITELMLPYFTFPEDQIVILLILYLQLYAFQWFYGNLFRSFGIYWAVTCLMSKLSPWIW